MAAAKSGGTPSTFPGQAQKPSATNTSPAMPTQHWPYLGYQIPGTAPPGTQKDADNLSQVIVINTLCYNSYLSNMTSL